MKSTVITGAQLHDKSRYAISKKEFFSKNGFGYYQVFDLESGEELRLWSADAGMKKASDRFIKKPIRDKEGRERRGMYDLTAVQ